VVSFLCFIHMNNNHHHHHTSFMELDHLLTHSSPMYPEVSSKVCHNSFSHLGSNISLPWVIYFEAFYLHVVSSFSCIPVICPKLVLFLTPLQFLHLFCNLSNYVLLFFSCTYFISAAVIILVSVALIAQVSLPNKKTGRTSVLYSFILVFLRVFCSLNTFQIPVIFKKLFTLLSISNSPS